MEENDQVVEEQTTVERTAERIARRDLLRRGGKFAVLTAFAGWALGSPAAARAHPSSSPHCETIGFGCDCIAAECRQNGVVCAKRFGSCPSGGYCWTQNYNGNNITCCDWTCAGHACHCCRIN
jgi:hypothetical protein